jgi:hypothetical protein
MVIHLSSWATLQIQTRHCARHARQWCHDTWHRITHDPGYADAVAALLLAAIELLVRGQEARRFLTRLIHTLLTVIRSLQHGPDLDEGYWA